ncbi:MAG: UDP-glucose 4-epimerase [Candidatus Lindowbacteria bacterium RIFCSPLOWO2_12_FULL_62_27]|nr:MAG: UDP-glucose 4-epimerase [Candidatus Lindowbacteria bacterium RIFCSPLOWO2_02_FULL_62_12]OGH60919.1 MAG: UDP-glucose 4-epimerase [Candidatus Lindowbacteria bacterium RIFCSPLOWO2_12_FULL_62_27]
MRVAITGGAGYVGSALVPYLIDLGHEVTVLDLFLYGENVFNGLRQPGRLACVKGDIRNPADLAKAFKGAEAVIHLACISNDPSFELDPHLGKSINYDAFAKILAAVRGCGARRFIYASSSSVYGVQDVPNVREDTPCLPLTDYSKFKLLCEQDLQAADLGGCERVVIRPATVCGYAPRMRLDLTVNILSIHALVRKLITVHGGGQLRPNINIRDMIEAYRILLEAPADKVAGQTFNAGYENHSVADIAEMVRAEVRDPAVQIKVEPTVDNRSYHINSDRIANLLGFRARHTIRDAVRSICDAYAGGLMPDPMGDRRYYNIKTMQAVGLR